jgi:hypothetical protein
MLEIKWDITADTNEVQKLFRKHFENLYPNKLENQEEMDKFLNRHTLPNLNKDDIKH